MGAVSCSSDEFFPEIFTIIIYRIISKDLDIFPKLFLKINNYQKMPLFYNLSAY